MKEFFLESMSTIIKYLEQYLENHNEISIKVLNPAVNNKAVLGQKLIVGNEEFIYQPLSSWTDLAQILFCKVFITKLEYTTMTLKFEKLDTKNSFHNIKKDDINLKYGENSAFFNINKNENPSFINSYLLALKSVKVENRKNILNLGVNSADEFEVITDMLSEKQQENMQFYGVDLSDEAINIAKKKFDKENFHFFCHDIKHLDGLNLTKTDLLISIATLQSVSSNFKVLFMDIIQKYLNKDGAVILGFPNCRWLSGEAIFGAKNKNYSFTEYTVLLNDIIFCKKYLQQKGFKVFITGKDYLFLIAKSLK